MYRILPLRKNIAKLLELRGIVCMLGLGVCLGKSSCPSSKWGLAESVGRY
jgi:hypothetical protein